MQSKVFKSDVPAKINLRLAVTGRRGNLHTLDMIVCPYEKLCDEITFIPSKDTEVGIKSVDVKFAYAGFKPARFKRFFMPKAQAIAEKLGVGGRLSIRKNIPLGAGLGGSTACIVGAIKAICAYLGDNFTELDNGFLLSLGSDVPCMLKGGLCRVRGVGEMVDALPFKPEIDFAVRIAKGGSDSAECYAFYDKLMLGEKLARAVDFGEDRREYGELGYAEFIKIVTECRNDLTLPATTLNPRIAKLATNMKKKYPYVIMSGSGSAVVGFKLKENKQNLQSE